MGLEEDVAAIITETLQKNTNKAVSLSSLGNLKNNLSKNKKKLLNVSCLIFNNSFIVYWCMIVDMGYIIVIINCN